MRLWHQLLIEKLPRQQLLGQHRECAALRGNGWGRRHAIVNYVFTHDPSYLVAYHYLIMNEMKQRGYHPDETWYNVEWRGSTVGRVGGWARAEDVELLVKNGNIIFPEHNDAYYVECVENLQAKGITI